MLKFSAMNGIGQNALSPKREESEMGGAVKAAWLNAVADGRTAEVETLGDGELKRLCDLYEQAVARADVEQARHLRAAISDLVDECCAGDRGQRQELRTLLGFPVDAGPTTLDQ